MGSIYWKDGKKVFNYGDYEVIIDFDKNTKEVLCFCGCCKTYSAKKYYGYSICLKCSKH